MLCLIQEAEFKLYIIKYYQCLKNDENSSTIWNNSKGTVSDAYGF